MDFELRVVNGYGNGMLWKVEIENGCTFMSVREKKQEARSKEKRVRWISIFYFVPFNIQVIPFAYFELSVQHNSTRERERELSCYREIVHYNISSSIEYSEMK